VYKWKIKVADNLKELEKLVEQIQSEGWTVEKIDVKSISVVAYKAKETRPDLLVEQQEEGRVTPQSGFEWDRGDYGQQGL
tara:strand:+ start:1070 stop:1309 length:240 start_codon:yes stop_codon:yes gene_type:complete